MYAYEAEHWRTCPYTIIAFSVNRYVSLTGFREFTPFPTRDTIESTIENTALQTRYRSIILAKNRALIIASSNWATWWQRRVQRPIGAQDASPAMTTFITITGRKSPTLPMREIEYDRSNWVRTPFLPVNWARSSARDAATEWSYPWINNINNQRRSRETIYESAQLLLLSFYLSWVHLSQLACTPIALATSKEPTSWGILRRLIPTDTLLERRRIPMEEDQCTNEALLPPRTFARAKCPYGDDTLRLKHIYNEKLSLDWSEL